MPDVLTTAAPLLLRGAPTSHAPAASRDFQVRVGRPATVDADGCTPCVLVLTRAVDGEIDDVSLRLAAQGIPLLRVDSDRCTHSWMQWLPASGVLDVDGQRLRPRVCWTRYFDAASIAAPDAVVRGYAAENWSAFALAIAAQTARTVNAGARPGCPDRVTQLSVAARHGLRVPATVVTTSPRAALAGLPGDGDVIVKALGRHAVEASPGELSAVLPRRLPRHALADDEPAPVLVQEYVPAPHELRIHVVGEELIGYAITRPSPEALWTRPDSIGVRVTGIEPSLARTLRRIARALGLDVAAFDLLATDDGPVFLEVNAECDWRWADHAAGGTATADAVCRYLAKLYADTTGSSSW